MVPNCVAEEQGAAKLARTRAHLCPLFVRANGGGEDGHSRLFHLRFNLCAWLLVHALRLTRAHRKRNRSEMGYVSQLCGRGARSRNARSYSCTFYARGLCLVDKKVNTSCYDMLCRIVSHFCRAEQSKSRLADNLRDVRLTCGMRRWPR